jgi:cbb3-type cytochrome oxidase maturation protein
MNILLALIPISILLLVIAVLAFFWAVRKRQFENLDVAALDVLTDDSKPDVSRDKDQDAN